MYCNCTAACFSELFLQNFLKDFVFKRFHDLFIHLCTLRVRSFMQTRYLLKKLAKLAKI